MIVKTEQDEIARYLSDASNMPGGAAERVCLIESADEVALLLADAHARGIAVTVAGAGTGLSGASIPIGGTVLAMSRLNGIGVIDAAAMRVSVEPGAMLGDVQVEVERHSLFYPPDPTERTCSIGGTIATNASGARTFKYGPTRNYIDELDVVLATGERLHLVRGVNYAVDSRLSLTTLNGRTIDLELPMYVMPAVKHAAGYFATPDMDAIDLFIGSEGTLGVVTRAALRLIPLPERIVSGVVFFVDEASTIAFVDTARARSRSAQRDDTHADDLAVGASAIEQIDARALEFIDGRALEFVRDAYPNIPGNAAGGAIWFEQEVSEADEEAMLAEWYALMLAHGALVDESWFAISTEDQRRMREFRHAVPSSVYEFITANRMTKIGTDMAVPDGRLGELLEFYRSEFARTGLNNITWGHIGNNHLHANVLAANGEEYAVGRELYGRFVERTLELGGTVSAEHGIGKLKKAYLEKMFGRDGIEAMRQVKRALDPHGILGPGTMFDM